MGNVAAKIGGGLGSITQTQFSLWSPGSVQSISYSETVGKSGEKIVTKHLYQGPGKPVTIEVDSTASYSNDDDKSLEEGDDESSTRGTYDKPYWKFDQVRGTFVPTPQYSIITAPHMTAQKVCEFCWKEGPSSHQKWGFKWICDYCRKCLERWPTWTEEDIVRDMKDTPTRINAFYFTNKHRKISNSRVRSKISKDYTHNKTRKVVNRIARYKPILRKCRMKELGVDVDADS